MPAATITVGDVVRNIETDFGLVECFDAVDNTCVLDGQCRPKHLLQDATSRFLDALDGLTLAELLTPGPKRAVALKMSCSVTPSRARRVWLQSRTQAAARRRESPR
jgi:Rrf2 family nitric oxide-sensitive transcriptional repressor